MVSCGCLISKQELDQFAKNYVGLEGSTTQMSNDELSDLIEGTYFLATQIGLELINPKDKNELLIQLNFTK